MDNRLIHTYEEACKLIKKVGILPLSSFIPDYPSLEALTNKEDWYTGSEADPWLWRARFPRGGIAAYGKFFKKKSILVSRELFPLVRGVLGDRMTVKERYESGLISKAVFVVYNAIHDAGEIETRALRAATGMKAKESKTQFDNALVELQESMDIVISGMQERLNGVGNKNGWNSTSYELTDHWMEQKGIAAAEITSVSAKTELLDHLKETSSEQAVIYLQKALKL